MEISDAVVAATPDPPRAVPGLRHDRRSAARSGRGVPGTHRAIRGVSIFDDGHELTVVIDDLTHGHFAEYDDGLPEAERERRIVDSVVEFLDDLFADRVAVWGQQNVGGGWYRVDLSESGVPAGIAEFVWSGPRTKKARLTVLKAHRLE